MIAIQHASFLKDLSLKRRATDNDQLVAWATDLREKLYLQCETAANNGSLWITIQYKDLSHLIPTIVPSNRLEEVCFKTKSLFEQLEYKFDIEYSSAVGTHGLSFNDDTINSITISWE